MASRPVLKAQRGAGARSPSRLVEFVRSSLEALADPPKAREMAAYMKTTQPFLGVQQPLRAPIYREMNARFEPAGAPEYRAGVLALWFAGTQGEEAAPVEEQALADDGSSAARPSTRADTEMSPPIYAGPREMMYAACAYAERFKSFHTPAHLPLFKRMIEDGGWWDLVDWVSDKMVGSVLLQHRAKTAPVMRRWIDDPNLWVRRTAIICQISHKDRTDPGMLYEFVLRRANEQDFFIRKAIGWALRQYARTDAEGVRRFLLANSTRLSSLSIREAGKHLGIAPAATSPKPLLVRPTKKKLLARKAQKR
jgi:3-methyladenine DNA glycosylase AlkD